MASTLRRYLAPVYARRWRPGPQGSGLPGYSVLLMVPADVPVFAKLAALTCASQEAAQRREVLLVPDGRSKGFARTWESLVAEACVPDLNLVRLGRRDRALLRLARNPHLNCWVQLLRGAEAARGTHLLWHDADLFLDEPGFMDRHYERALAEDLACLGVDRPWDPWLEAKGFDHVVATWEAIFDLDWLRSFPPWRLRGHEARLAGERHSLDLTFWAQCQTPPARVGRHDLAGCSVHFNHVVCTYRWFQQAPGPYEDEHFRLLLIRLLELVFPEAAGSEIPRIPDLRRGLTDAQARVTYRRASTAAAFPEFHAKFQNLLCHPLFTARAGQLSEALRPFEQAFL